MRRSETGRVQPGGSRQQGGAGPQQAELKRASVDTTRLTALTVLLGALIVFLSQLVTGFTLVDETDSVIANVTLLDTHGLIAALFALVAAMALVFAIATGSRAAVAVVIAMGIGVVLVFFFIDLPDVGDTGLFNTPGAGNLDATGKGSAGLWMELIGGIVLILGGAALARLDESQLRAIRPRAATGQRSRAGIAGKPNPRSQPGPKDATGSKGHADTGGGARSRTRDAEQHND